MTTTPANLEAAYEGSFYTILGAGGDLNEWTDGLSDFLVAQGVGKPAEWFTTTGKAINDFAGARGHVPALQHFQDELTVLMFPLDGLHGGKLAMFRLQAGDRWFDDVIDNMVDDASEDDDEL